MSSATPQPISVLSTAKNGLVYLTPNDWALVVDKAVRMQFNAGDTIVHKGKRTNGLYLVLKGTAWVQIPCARHVCDGQSRRGLRRDLVSGRTTRHGRCLGQRTGRGLFSGSRDLANPVRALPASRIPLLPFHGSHSCAAAAGIDKPAGGPRTGFSAQERLAAEKSVLA